MAMKNVTIRLDELLTDCLEAAAVFTRQTGSDIIRESVKGYINHLAETEPEYAEIREKLVEAEVVAAAADAYARAGLSNSDARAQAGATRTGKSD